MHDQQYENLGIWLYRMTYIYDKAEKFCVDLFESLEKKKLI